MLGDLLIFSSLGMMIVGIITTFQFVLEPEFAAEGVTLPVILLLVAVGLGVVARTTLKQ